VSKPQIRIKDWVSAALGAVVRKGSNLDSPFVNFCDADRLAGKDLAEVAKGTPLSPADLCAQTALFKKELKDRAYDCVRLSEQKKRQGKVTQFLQGRENSFAGIHARLIRVAATFVPRSAMKPFASVPNCGGLRDSEPIKGRSKFLVNYRHFISQTSCAFPV
jgi:hypothetical protein